MQRPQPPSQLAKNEMNAFRLQQLTNELSIYIKRGYSTESLGAYQGHQPQRVLITGLGLVTPLGIGKDVSWKRLMGGETGVRKLSPQDLPKAHEALLPSLPSQVAALVPRHLVSKGMADLKQDLHRLSPFMQYAMLAAEEALRDASLLTLTEDERMRTGVSIGSGMSSTMEVYEAGQAISDGKLRRITPFFVPRILNNMAAGAISILYGLHGPVHSVSTACATGVHSIGDAFRMIQRGEADVMLAGSSESCIDAISIGGFSRLKALSTSFNDQKVAHQASRPFDSNRDGFVIGEGAGVLVLESMDHARRREARSYAEVRGYGLSGDGYHITQPHPEGLGAKLSMQRALSGSGLDASDVGYINAHATSTPLGDEVEQRAILSVFGEAACSSGRLRVSSTKGATGHLLGAAGSVEAIFTALAIHHCMVPPNLNLFKPQGPLSEYPRCLIREGEGRSNMHPLRAALCNSFGFGGTNASLLLTSPPSALAHRL